VADRCIGDLRNIDKLGTLAWALLTALTVLVVEIEKYKIFPSRHTRSVKGTVETPKGIGIDGD